MVIESKDHFSDRAKMNMIWYLVFKVFKGFRQTCSVVQWYNNELSLRYSWLEMFLLENVPI